MKTSYKVSLIVAAGICVLVIAYYANQGGSGSKGELADAVHRHTSTPNSVQSHRSGLSDLGSHTTDHTTTPRTDHNANQNTHKPDSADSLLARLRRLQANARKQAHQPTSTPPAAAGSTVQANAQNANSAAPHGGMGNHLATAQIPSTQPTESTSTLAVTPPVSTGQTQTHASVFSPAAASQQTASTPVARIANHAGAPPSGSGHPPTANANGAGIPSTYTIKAGDSFASLARHFYGTEQAMVDIAKANPTVNPRKLQVGQQIKLPPRSSTQANHPGTGSQSAPPGAKIYKVQPGDTLSYIARYFYGSPTKWHKIYDANRKAIGPDPANLKAGMKLIIPPKSK